MCISDERSLLQENKYFITIIWTQSCLLLSDDVCMREIATTIWCQKWDSLDVTSGPDSGRRQATLELKVPTLPRKKKRFRDEGPFPLLGPEGSTTGIKKTTQVAQNDISGKSQLNSI